MESKQIERPFFIILLLAVFGLVFFIFLPYLNAIVLAITFALLFRPFYNGLLKVMPRKQGFAAFLTVVFVFVIVLAPLTLFGFQIFKEAGQLYARVAESDGIGAAGSFMELVKERLRAISPTLSLDINAYSKQILGWILQNISAVFASIAAVIITFFLSLFALYYLLKDGQKLRQAVERLSPLSRPHTEEIISKLGTAANSVIRGSLVVAIIQGILAGLGFLIFGIPHATFWGSVAVVASLVPMLGTGLVMGPAVIYLFLVSNSVFALGLFLWGFFAVGLIDNFLRPQLIKRGVQIHPFLILLSVLGGIGLFGPMGFLLGPLILSFLFALLDIYPAIILHRENN